MGDTPELYNLHDDPLGNDPIFAESPKHREIAARMKKDVLDWRKA